MYSTRYIMNKILSRYTVSVLSEVVLERIHKISSEHVWARFDSSATQIHEWCWRGKNVFYTLYTNPSGAKVLTPRRLATYYAPYRSSVQELE